jgi:hypothetical protein
MSPIQTTIAVGFCISLISVSPLRADAPVGTYLFPAGGQRGTVVDILAGGLFLNKSCNFEIVGPGVSGPSIVRRVNGPAFEGPILPLPESQRQEDYPRSMAASIKIAADAPTGNRHVRLWTSQGVTLPMAFVVGDLPEIVEKEIDGSPIPVFVNPPVTINGRIYPRENIDIWTVRLKKGQVLSCSVAATSISSPLEALLEIRDANGRKLTESRDDLSPDPRLRFTANEDGDYNVHIGDIRSEGGPAFVYRLTLTTGPVVDRVFPLGGKRGAKTRFQLSGSQMPGTPVEIAIPKNAGSTFSARYESSNEYHLDADDLTEVRESNEQGDPVRANFLPVPAIGNGRIGRPGEAGVWNFTAKQGEALEVELRAHRLGSPLLGVLTIREGSGKELARTEATAQGDPLLRFTAPATGFYSITVQDRFSSRGGPAFAYRLRVDRPAPGFDLQFGLPSLTIVRGQQTPLRVTAVRHGNLTAPIRLRLEGLPVGVTIPKETIIPANQTSIDIPLKAETSAKILSFTLCITGTAYQPLLPAMPLTISNRAVIRAGEYEAIENVRVAVAIPTPFKIAGDYVSQLIPRGTVYSRRFRIERGGFAGAVEIDLADRQARHLQGVTAPAIVLPPDKNEFDYAVQLPSWMETGRTCRVCVMGTATIKDADGSEHVVTYSSREQNDQIIAVVEPERLSLDLDRQALRVELGTEIEIGFNIGRAQGVTNPATVELEVPAHMKGIESARIELPASARDGKLRIRFSKDAKGPFNAPLTARAVVKDKGLPVTAEAKLELIPPRTSAAR